MHKPTRRDFLRSSSAAVLASTALHRTKTSHAADRPPNILLFFPDQHRYDWIGANPAVPVPTPNMDALARRGVHFANAVCPSPLCAPSRACLASGKEYDRCRVPDNKYNYPHDQTTFYRLLRDSGYHVLGCGKFDLHKKTANWGIEGKTDIDAWGFSDGIDNAGKGDGRRAYGNDPMGPKDPYYQHLSKLAPPLDRAAYDDMTGRRGRGGNYANTDPCPLPDEHYIDTWIATNGLKLIADTPPDKPWFLQVNHSGPHNPMDITERMAAEYRGPNRVIDEFPQPNRYTGPHDAATHTRIRQNYSAMVENIDRTLGFYIDFLEARGELDNTIIVYTSDHGEMLGDHNLWAKRAPYHASAGVPLVVAGPGFRKGYVHRGPSTILDLTATFLDCAGVAIPDDMDSVSMRPMLEGDRDDHREFVRSGFEDWRLIFDGRYKYIRGYDAPGHINGEFLFDLQEDPSENRNLARDEKNILDRLSRSLQDYA